MANALQANNKNVKLCLPPRFFEKGRLSEWVNSRLDTSILLHIDKFSHFLAKNRHEYLAVFDTYDLQYVSRNSGIDIDGLQFVLIDDLALTARSFSQGGVTIVPNILFPDHQSYAPSWTDMPKNRWLHGPSYVLLDPKFHMTDNERIKIRRQREARLVSCISGGEALRVLISFGEAVTQLEPLIKQRVSEALHLLKSQMARTEVIALGKSAIAMCGELGLECRSEAFLGLEKMRYLYTTSDVYLGAIGYSMWERSAMGLPSFVVPIAENQKPYAEIGDKLGIHNIMTVLSEKPSVLKNLFLCMIEKTIKLKFGFEGYLSLLKEAPNGKSS